MKRLFCLVAELCVLAACTVSEQIDPQVDTPSSGELVKKIVFEVLPIKDADDPETKASAVPQQNNTVAFAWEATDTVGIYPDRGSQVYFNIEDGVGTNSVSFDGGGWGLKQNSTYVSYYPFVGDIYLDREEIPVSFAGQKQIGTESPFSGARYFLATEPTSSSDGVLSFTYNTLNTIINVKATLPAGTYTKASLTVDEPLFVEEGTYSLNERVIVGTKYSNTLEIALEDFTLTEEAQVPVYVMSAPVDLRGKEVTVEFYASDGRRYRCVKNTIQSAYNAGTRYGLVCAMEEYSCNNIIYYTSSDGEVVTPYRTDGFGANIISNTYDDGQGIITFDGPVTSIGYKAFYECSGLTSLYIPSNVTSIGDFAFCDCFDLTAITIPSGVTSIGTGAFSRCSLSSITIPPSVISIGNKAFYECSSLTSITIPSSITSIDNYAFVGCIGLTSISIPSSVTSIGENPFAGCSSLASIIVDINNPYYDSRDNCNAIIEKSTNNLISGCKNTVIPSNVTSIGVQAFANCTNLSSISIPSSVSSIGYEAFSNCNGLTFITIERLAPPSGGKGMFNNTSNCPICVPAESVNAYKTAEFWCDYSDRIQLIEGGILPPPSNGGNENIGFEDWGD